MTWKLLALLTLLLAAASTAAAQGDDPVARTAAMCSDYSTQAEAQAAADTRDGNGDGIYCKSLPCPCSTGGDGEATEAPPAAPAPTPKPGCRRPSGVQRISFSMTRYPNIRTHYIDAVHAGWPRTLVINRPYADARRDRLLEDYATQDGYDRDEYPPAIGRGKGKGLVRGSHPRGWKASVDYVDSAENRSHGSRLGTKLRRFCNGTKFRYVFY